MSRVFCVLALALLIGIGVIGCDTDPSIIGAEEGEAAYVPTVGVYKITHHGDETSHSYFVQMDTETTESIPVLVLVGEDRMFVIIHEGERASAQYELEDRVEVLDAFERVKEILPAKAVGGETVQLDYNFLKDGRSYVISSNKAVAP